MKSENKKYRVLGLFVGSVGHRYSCDLRFFGFFCGRCREILILDEAFSGLDEAHIAKVMEGLKTLSEKCSVLVVTHDSRVFECCDVCIEV